jgi:GDP-L-fucose synthase
MLLSKIGYLKGNDMKKILVTGGSGLVGRYLQEMLPDAIYLSSKDCDLTDINCVDKLMFKHQPDIVIHLAARVGGILDNVQYPVEYLEQNVLMNTNLLSVCHKHNVKNVISILSTCIYPDVVETYPMKEEVMFDGPPTPSNFSYGLAKRTMAAHIDAYVKQYDKQWCYLIPCNLYGEFDKFSEHNSHFVAALIKKIHDADKQIELWGDGSPLRQFMHGKDLARVIKTMIDNDIYESMNVAPPWVYSIHEMAEIAIDACNKPHLKIMYDTEKPNGQHRKDVTADKLISLLGNFEFTSLSEGIRDTYTKIKSRQTLFRNNE